MTVNTGEVRVEFVGNGTSTVFPFPYQFFQQDDLEVWVTTGDPVSSAARQVLNVNYHVFGEMNPTGGTVTMIAAPKGGETLVIINHPDILQLTHYVNADDFPADSHEQALDRLTKICQWMSDRLDRTVHFPDYLPIDQLPPTGTGPEGFEFVEEAPTDNFTYGRRNQEWIHVTSEAASDGYTYGRVNGHWEKVLLLDGGTLTGGLILDKDSPLTDREAASKFYVDQVDKRVDLMIPTDAPSDGTVYGRVNNNWERVILAAGGTMTGGLILDKDSPLVDREAASKFYVDELAKRVDLIGGSVTEAPSDGTVYGRINGTWERSILAAGGTMTGPLVLSALTPLADPHAASKYYVDQVGKRVDIVFQQFAPLSSPVFTGNPTTPTPPIADADLTIANTAFVKDAITTYGMSDALADGAVYGRRNNVWAKSVNLAGDTMTGPLILSGDPGANINQAATKHYVDSTISAGGTFVDAPSDSKVYGRLNGAWQRSLNAGGDTLTGPLIAAADPSVALGVATKQYVDSRPATDPTKVLKAGDTMTGSLTVNGNITAVVTATTGTVYFGNTGTKYHSFDGATHVINGGGLAVTSGGLQVTGSAAINSGSLTVGGGFQFNGDNGMSSSSTGMVLSTPNGGGFVFRPYYGQVTNQIAFEAAGHIRLAGAGSNFIPLNGNSGGFACKTGNGFFVSGDHFNIYYENTNGQMYIYVNSYALGTINISSDYRIKKDVQPLPSMWDTVKALNPIKYTHKDFLPPSGVDPTKDVQEPLLKSDSIERWGFIAHEVQETTVSTASSMPKDVPDGIQDLNLAPVVAALTKALQEAMARIEALEAAA